MSLTIAESMTIKWLQTTMMPNSIYKRYSHYFRDLIIDGWAEEDLIKLPPKTFDLYELSQGIMRCSISEFVKHLFESAKQC